MTPSEEHEIAEKCVNFLEVGRSLHINEYPFGRYNRDFADALKKGTAVEWVKTNYGIWLKAFADEVAKQGGQIIPVLVAGDLATHIMKHSPRSYYKLGSETEV